MLYYCFFLISSVSAADINTNDTQIVSSIDNGKILSSENDVDILGEGEYTYTDLKNQINSATEYNIILNKGNYRYSPNDGDTIVISKPCEIDGQGSVIDMARLNHRAFDVTVMGVTINNLTIKNA